MKLVDEGQSGPQVLSNGDVATNGELNDQEESEWKVNSYTIYFQQYLIYRHND